MWREKRDGSGKYDGLEMGGSGNYYGQGLSRAGEYDIVNTTCKVSGDGNRWGGEYDVLGMGSGEYDSVGIGGK